MKNAKQSITFVSDLKKKNHIFDNIKIIIFNKNNSVIYKNDYIENYYKKQII